MVAFMFREGTARRVLLHAAGVAFLAPPRILAEAEAQLVRLARRTGLPHETLRSILADLFRYVEVVPMSRLRAAETRARKAARDAGDDNDWKYVAFLG